MPVLPERAHRASTISRANPCRPSIVYTVRRISGGDGGTLGITCTPRHRASAAASGGSQAIKVSCPFLAFMALEQAYAGAYHLRSSHCWDRYVVENFADGGPC